MDVFLGKVDKRDAPTCKWPRGQGATLSFVVAGKLGLYGKLALDKFVCVVLGPCCLHPCKCSRSLDAPCISWTVLTLGFRSCFGELVYFFLASRRWDLDNAASNRGCFRPFPCVCDRAIESVMNRRCAGLLTRACVQRTLRTRHFPNSSNHAGICDTSGRSQHEQTHASGGVGARQ